MLYKSECTREFKCDDGNTYMCHPRSCFFCDHCEDILYDFTNGPYSFLCEESEDIDQGLQGKCEKFIED